MGLFDSIRATLSCHVCGSSTEREIQTKKGALYLQSTCSNRRPVPKHPRINGRSFGMSF